MQAPFKAFKIYRALISKIAIGRKVGYPSPSTGEQRIQNIISGCAILLFFTIDKIVPTHWMVSLAPDFYAFGIF